MPPPSTPHSIGFIYRLLLFLGYAVFRFAHQLQRNSKRVSGTEPSHCRAMRLCACVQPHLSLEGDAHGAVLEAV